MNVIAVPLIRFALNRLLRPRRINRLITFLQEGGEIGDDNIPALKEHTEKNSVLRKLKSFGLFPIKNKQPSVLTINHIDNFNIYIKKIYRAIFSLLANGLFLMCFIYFNWIMILIGLVLIILAYFYAWTYTGCKLTSLFLEKPSTKSLFSDIIFAEPKKETNVVTE